MSQDRPAYGLWEGLRREVRETLDLLSLVDGLWDEEKLALPIA